MKWFQQTLLVISCFWLALEQGKAQKNAVPMYCQHIANNDELLQIENKYERFKQQNLGHFSSAEHTSKLPNERDQEFIVIPIFQDTRPGEFWIYIEYFGSSMVDQPLEQRIQRYVRINRDSMRAETYHFNRPENYIQEYTKAQPFAGITSEDYFHDAGCDAYIVEDPDNPHTRKVIPVEEGCRMANSSGLAKYSAAHFTITDTGYLMCIDFLDEQKKIVKPCIEGGIFFKRLDYREKGYMPLAEMTKKLYSTQAQHKAH